MATKNVVPRTGSEGEIGTSAKPWNKGHFNYLSVTGSDSTGIDFGTDAEQLRGPVSVQTYADQIKIAAQDGHLILSGTGADVKVFSSNEINLNAPAIVLDGALVANNEATFHAAVTINGDLDVSGSSRFGNELTDTHIFTGSFHQTGSGATSYFKDTIDVEGNLTASGHVSASNLYLPWLRNTVGLPYFTPGSDNTRNLFVWGADTTSEYLALGIANADQAAVITAGFQGSGPAELAFQTSNLTSGEAERMRIDVSGNVGIGTNTPLALLHLEGDTVPGIQIHNTLTNGGNFSIYTMNSATETTLRIYDDDAAENRMGIDGDGNVAIGTNDPDHKLTVIGDISASLNVSASAFYGDGSGLTGVTSVWSGQHNGDAAITGSLVVSSQIYNSGEDNGAKGANFIIDWDTGMTQEVVLSASIAATLSASFNNIKPYATYQLIKKTGKDNMELYFDHPAGIFWPGGIRPSLSNISGSRDIITFTTDGDSNMYGTAQFDYSASVG